MILHRFLRTAAVLVLALPPFNSVQAQDVKTYPERPVRIVVAFQAGSYSDIVARLLAERLATTMQGSFLVENRVGAGGNIGTEHVARSAPDGYTLLFVSVATHGINPGLYSKLPYDAQKDFVPISLTMKVPNVAVVRSSQPWQSLAEFTAFAKANPAKVNYASAGNGTSQHLTGELFKSLSGADIVHVPYKGSPSALADLLGGQVQVSFLNLPFILAHVTKGDLRALAVTSERRFPGLPNVPTGAEAGLPGFVATSWSGMVAPAGTPPAIVARLSNSLRQIIRAPDMQKHFAENGAEPVGSTPEEFAAFIAEEISKWRAVVAKSGAKTD